MSLQKTGYKWARVHANHGSIVKQSILFKAQSWIWFTAKYSESRQEQLVKLYTQSKLLLAYLWPLICYAMMENTSMFSPVTMTVRMLAWWRSCSTPGVSGFSLFCMMMRPRNSMFASMWSLIQRKTYMNVFVSNKIPILNIHFFPVNYLSLKYFWVDIFLFHTEPLPFIFLFRSQNACITSMQSTLPVDVLDLVPSKFWFEPPMSESNDSETLLCVAFQNRCKVFWHCKEMNTITGEPISDSSVTNSKKRRQKPKIYRFIVQAPTLTTTLNTNFGATKSLSWSMLNHPGKKVTKSLFCSSENSFQMNRIYFWDKIIDIPGQRYICRKMYKRKK